MEEPKDSFVPEAAVDPADWLAACAVEPDERELRAIADFEAGRFISNAAVMR